MSSFFTVPASQRKRKRDDRNAAPGTKKRGADAKNDSAGDRRAQEREESISGSDSDEDGNDIVSGGSGEESESDSEDGETAGDRRLKLAERYLDNIREEVDDVGFDAAEIDKDLIAERLKEDVDEFKGRTFRRIASKLSFPKASHSFFRSDTQTTTSIAVHAPFVYTVSKDKVLTKWELATPNDPNATASNENSKRPPRPQRKKPKRVSYARGVRKVAETGEEQGHTASILSVAVSPSGRFVATGGADKKLIIWNADTLTPAKTFTQHRDSVSCLSFARHISTMSSGEQLFSGSYDRTIKTWSVSGAGHAYVETLFGHQSGIEQIAAMTIDECVSVGGQDRSSRLWKVIDETQLVFRGGASKNAPYHETHMDCVAPLPPAHFVTGSNSGSISLWSIHKKKPLHTIPLAHGLDSIPPLDELSPEVDLETAAHNARHMRPMPRWITALTSLPGTDIILSGSWDGWIRAWQISEDKRTIIPLGPIGTKNPTQASPNTPSKQLNSSLDPDDMDAEDQTQDQNLEPGHLIKGVVNDIAVFERRPESEQQGVPFPKSRSEPKSESEVKGLCIVAAIGKEHRLGRWKCYGNNYSQGASPEGRNGAVVLEVPFISNAVEADV